jgi:hypothetical protein
MEHPTFASRLRYLDAHDVDDSIVDFQSLDVRGVDGSSLGDLDGFLVDATSGRVLYTVVDSRGWFRSRRVLVPIGHATVDRQKGALCLDVTRDTLRNYPEFDESRFREFSDEDLRTYEQRMAQACCPDESPQPEAGGSARRHYQQPAWLASGIFSLERLRPVESRPYAREPLEG